MLTPTERRARLPHRTVTAVALHLNCQASDVSRVLAGRTRNDAIERCLAAAMYPATTQEEAFGPPVPASAHETAAFYTVDGVVVALTAEDVARATRGAEDRGAEEGKAAWEAVARERLTRRTRELEARTRE